MLIIIEEIAMKISKRWYRVSEVGTMISFGRTKIRELVEDGELKPVWINGEGNKPLRICGKSLKRFVEKHEIE